MTLWARRPGNTFFLRLFGDFRPRGLGTPVYGGSNRKFRGGFGECTLVPVFGTVVPVFVPSFPVFGTVVQIFVPSFRFFRHRGTPLSLLSLSLSLSSLSLSLSPLSLSLFLFSSLPFPLEPFGTTPPPFANPRNTPKCWTLRSQSVCVCVRHAKACSHPFFLEAHAAAPARHPPDL